MTADVRGRDTDGTGGSAAGRVFISYSHEDQAYVERLAAHIEAAGIPVWYDYQIATGERFDHVIAAQIDACAAFVVVMSPASADSTWVFNEINHAMARDKTILPLLLDGEVHLSLRHAEYVDVRGGRLPDQRFMDRLGQLVGRPDPTPATPPPSTPAVRPTPAVAADPGEPKRTVSAGGGMGGALTRYRVMAYVTGVLLIVLLTGTAMKLFWDQEIVVKIVGPAHGFLYMVYLVTAFDLAVRAKWRFVRTVLVLLAGTVPVMSFYAERRVTAWVRSEPLPSRDEQAAVSSQR